MNPIRHPRHGGAAGAIVTILLVLGLVALGAWVVMKGDAAPTDGGTAPSTAAGAGGGTTESGEAPDATALVEVKAGIPQLAPALAYEPKGDVIEVDISEYAGYAGLIVANGGMAPNPESFFAKEYGFQVKLSLSETENWSELNNGRFAAAATTADVLAVLGRQFQAVVPAQIAFSRGADGVVVQSAIRNVNELKGKVLACAQHNESEFFIRYLAQEAGLKVVMLDALGIAPKPDEVGLVFCADAFAAGDLFASELERPQPRLAGCVTWAPKTDEVVEASGGRARILTTNKNLLIIADVLVVNKGFAAAQPKKVQGLVHGLLHGNRLVRTDPKPWLKLIATSLSVPGGEAWSEADAADELTRVHLSNLPENLAFFSGTIDSAGSFGGIYQSSVLAYGPGIITDPIDAERFIDYTALKALDAAGHFKGEKLAIAPIKSSTASAIEGSQLLSKDIRFLFQPNSAVLDMSDARNLEWLKSIRSFLQVSPGSMVLLRGHVDDTQRGDFQAQGGDQLVRSMALKAMELSKQRAAAVRAQLVNELKVDPARLEMVGRGWEEPLGGQPELNRRVEVQWFTLE
ncbi:MAG TPA: phosphate ABC transporter substrate-binding/OmpA family protein [Planctomycetota bacterium]|nr:phosphate ABC transporter substrate-binding/OmpA family protein [Planctomycetota bacterium]